MGCRIRLQSNFYLFFIFLKQKFNVNHFSRYLKRYTLVRHRYLRP